MNTLNAPEQTVARLLVDGFTFVPWEYVGSEGERVILQGLHSLADAEDIVLRVEACVGPESENSFWSKRVRLVKVLPRPERVRGDN